MTIPAITLTEIVTILSVLTLFYMSVPVGRARAKHGIKAPSMTGHEEMDRAVRVHMNSLEQFALYMPLLWVATLTFTLVTWLPAAMGVLWIVGRLIYMQAYLADPARRSAGFGITMLSTAALLVLSVVGVVMSWSTAAG
ncbi:MAG TPA: MAPEG family protein [Rhizomicrobium sp.]|nr:MAPEG family protein [Rhizomicrobium sp.]